MTIQTASIDTDNEDPFDDEYYPYDLPDLPELPDLPYRLPYLPDFDAEGYEGMERLIYDKAADSDELRMALADRGIELICPHRKGRKRPPRQDGRPLRRYRRRWIVERSIAWLGNYRRLLIRHEYYPEMFLAFVHIACALIALSRL